MSNSEYWICDPSNLGRTCWAVSAGGIPDVKPSWRKNVGRYGLLGELCMTHKEIYARSAGDILAVNVENGSKIWENPFRDNGHKGRGLCINQNQLCAGLYILERATGSVLVDFREVWGRDDIGDYSFVMPFKDGFIRSFDYPQAGCYFISTKEKEGIFLVEDIRGIISQGQRVVYGWQKNIIKAFDIEARKVIWEYKISLKTEDKHASAAGFSVLGERLILQLWSATLLCFNNLTGELLWTCEEQDVAVDRNAQNYAIYQSDILAACNDRIYMGKSRRRHGWLQCHHINGGDFLWKVDAPESMSLCIAGDLLFGVRDASILTAWDRYTGQEVWHAKDPMTAAYHVMAAGNKIIYSATTGEVRCYEWIEPYISPARPA